MEHGHVPRLVVFETTLACGLKCHFCKAAAIPERLKEELTVDEYRALVEDIASFAAPVIILSGGDPLIREDIYDIASYISEKGLIPVLATSGPRVDAKTAQRIKDAGVRRVSLSLDGATPESHDALRGVAGSFQMVMDAIHYLKEAGVPFQINTTVCRRNIAEVPRIMEIAEKEGAVAFHLFGLIPTGRGSEWQGEEPSPEEYERLLNWYYEASRRSTLETRATCMPHYYRIIRQRARDEGRQLSPEKDGMDAFARGCLAGQSFCFVSYQGDIWPCGYLPLSAGNVRERTFREIWESSELFNNLRVPDHLKGKCGACEFRRVCMGCRARAYAETGDYMQEEAYCAYVPPAHAEA